MSFRKRIVSKAPKAPPPLPTTGGSYTLDASSNRWIPTAPTTAALIEAPTDASNIQQDGPGES